MTVENISWSISTKECCLNQQGKKTDFQDGIHDSHLVQWSGTIPAILVESHLGNIPVQFVLNWPRGVYKRSCHLNQIVDAGGWTHDWHWPITIAHQDHLVLRWVRTEHFQTSTAWQNYLITITTIFTWSIWTETWANSVHQDQMLKKKNSRWSVSTLFAIQPSRLVHYQMNLFKF